jgi:nucleoside 2-deoxyribosyltransferase
MTKLFIAYPSDPATIGSTIENAKEEAKVGAPGLYITTWRRDDLSGQSLITPIIEAITASDIAVADITNLNFNVIYELGYAVGLGKRVLPVFNSSLAFDKDTVAQVGIFDTLIYEPYSTSTGLLNLFRVAEPGRRIATAYPIDPQPLFIVLPPVMTDDANQILTRTLKAGLRSRKFDCRYRKLHPECQWRAVRV